MTSPILITGGTGALGRQVVARLREAGCQLRVLSRHAGNAADGAVHVPGDLLTGEGIEGAVDRAEIIVHCAGNGRDDERMTRHLVRAASGLGYGSWFIFR